jgi:hypothetical protein
VLLITKQNIKNTHQFPGLAAIVIRKEHEAIFIEAFHQHYPYRRKSVPEKKRRNILQKKLHAMFHW